MRAIDWKKVGNAIVRGFAAASAPCGLLLAPLPIPHWAAAAIAGLAGIGSAASSVFELWKTPPFLA